MPGLVVNEDTSTNPTPLHLILLHLPSSVAPVDRVSVCPTSLCTVEAELRYGQACDALEEVRRHLRTRTCTNRFKIKNITGQRANTRARTLQNNIDKKVKLSVAKYRCARQAYLALVGPGEWEDTLRLLDKADVRALNERSLTEHEKEERRQLRLRVGLPNEDDQFAVEETTVGGAGEGHRRLSWIWFRPSGDDDEDNPAMNEGEMHILILAFTDLSYSSTSN
jgi:hypothetical protein